MSEEIKNYEDLEEKFKKQFKEDITKDEIVFLEHRKFYPNPVISLAPKYCLVALEPALKSSVGKEEGKKRFVDQLFMQSMNNLIIQYCAYKYLCSESFDYQITDVCKVPLTTPERTTIRKKIYSKWENLFSDEIKILNNPKLIAIGYTTEKYLINFTNYSNDAIPHYSSNNNSLFNELLEKHGSNANDLKQSNNKEYIDLYKEIKEFAQNKLVPQINSNSKLLNRQVADINEELFNVIINKKVAQSHKVRYFVYKKIFTEIAEKK
ncbi:MAG: hypothetical protein WCR42_02995 [bacterium]